MRGYVCSLGGLKYKIFIYFFDFLVALCLRFLGCCQVCWFLNVLHCVQEGLLKVLQYYAIFVFTK